MAHPGLYRYPFDKDGEPVLTFGEAIAAARVLETQLSAMMERWTWPELSLTIIEHRTSYVRYEVRRDGKVVGYATVMPFSVEPPKREPASADEKRILKDEGQRGGGSRGA
jgi:hypothetical protein